MKPPAVDWLREAIITEFAMAGLVASQDKNTALPSLDIVVEQFFVEQVDNFFLFLILCDQAAITMIRVTVTSPDGSVAYDRRFVGHLEDINQVDISTRSSSWQPSYDLGDLLHKTAQQALSEAASETRLSSNGARFDELSWSSNSRRAQLTIFALFLCVFNHSTYQQ